MTSTKIPNPEIEIHDYALSSHSEDPISGFGKMIFAMLFCTFSLQATTCEDLCNKFGDYHGCQRLAAGETDCTFPPKEPTTTTPTQTDAAAPSTTAHFYTQWRNRGGIRMRFEVTVGEESMAFMGQAQPALDPYFVRFSPSALQSDHMIDVDMQCQPAGVSRYHCQDKYTHRKVTVAYHRTGANIFDLKVYEGKSLAFHIYSDRLHIHTRYYHHDQIIKRLSEHYPILLPQ